jgi:hypothetical protein
MLLTMSTAYRTSQLVYVAAKLGIADMLVERPQTCEEIAGSLGASSDALCRVMRGLAVHGVFERLDDGRYSLTEMSQPLRSGVDGSVRPALIYWGQEHFRAWSDLLHTVMTGEQAFHKIFGEPFEYYERHPEAGETFDTFMTTASSQVAVGIAYNYEFPDRGTVVDVGGGEGVLLATILKSRPGLSGVLFDRPSVVDKARRRLEAEGVLSRCRVESGDFREAVPRGGDVYILRNVIHDWDDDNSVRILTACMRAMKKTARLLVVQRVVPDELGENAFSRGVVEGDLMQLVYNGGRERTAEEYRALIEAAGMRIQHTMAADGNTWLMEARKK